METVTPPVTLAVTVVKLRAIVTIAPDLANLKVPDAGWAVTLANVKLATLKLFDSNELSIYQLVPSQTKVK